MEHKTSASKSVGKEVIRTGNLLSGTFASSGHGVRVNVLETQIFKNANFSLNIMIGDEAINTTTHAYTELLFNIQLGSYARTFPFSFPTFPYSRIKIERPQRYVPRAIDGVIFFHRVLAEAYIYYLTRDMVSMYSFSERRVSL